MKQISRSIVTMIQLTIWLHIGFRVQAETYSYPRTSMILITIYIHPFFLKHIMSKPKQKIYISGNNNNFEMIPSQISINHKVVMHLGTSFAENIKIDEKDYKKEVTCYDGIANVIKKINVDAIFVEECICDQAIETFLAVSSIQQWNNKLFMLMGDTKSKTNYLMFNSQKNKTGKQSNQNINEGIIAKIFKKINQENKQSNSNRLEIKILQIDEQKIYSLSHLRKKDDKKKSLLFQKQISLKENDFIEIKNEQMISEIGKQVDLSKYQSNNIVTHVRIILSPRPQIKQPLKSINFIFVQFSSLLFLQTEIETEVKRDCYSLSKFLKNLNKMKTQQDYKKQKSTLDSQFCNYLYPFLLNIKEWRLFCSINENESGSLFPFLPYMEQFCNIKSDKMLQQALKKEIDRQQQLYKKLTERHKTVFNILGKCINLQYCQIDKRTSLYMQWLPINNQRSDKLRIANVKKQQNQQFIQQLQKQIALKQTQINEINQKHKRKIQQLELEKTRIQESQKRINMYLTDLNNPPLKSDGTILNVSLYSKAKRLTKKPQKQFDNIIQNDSGLFTSKSNMPSHKVLTKKKMDIKNQEISILRATNNNLSRIMKLQTKQTANVNHRCQKIKYNEAASELIKLSKIVIKQQKLIDQLYQHNFNNLSNKLINRYKNSRNKHTVNTPLIQQCLSQDFQQKEYQTWINDQLNFDKFMKQIKQKSLTSQTTHSLKESY